MLAAMPVLVLAARLLGRFCVVGGADGAGGVGGTEDQH